MGEIIEQQDQEKNIFRRDSIRIDLLVAGILAGALGFSSFVSQILLSQAFFDLSESQSFYATLENIIMWPYWLFSLLVFEPLGHFMPSLAWGLAFFLGAVGFPFIVFAGWGAAFFFSAYILRKFLGFSNSILVHSPAVLVVAGLIVPFIVAIGPVSNRVDNCLSGEYARPFTLPPLDLGGDDLGQDLQYDEDGKAYIETVAGTPNFCFKHIIEGYVFTDNVDGAIDFCVALSDEKQVVSVDNKISLFEPAGANYQQYCIYRLSYYVSQIDRMLEDRNDITADFYDKYASDISIPTSSTEYKKLPTEERTKLQDQFHEALCRVYGDLTAQSNEDVCLGYLEEEKQYREERKKRSGKQQEFSDMIGTVTGEQKITYILKTWSQVASIHDQIEAYKNYQSNRMEGDAVLKTIKAISKSSRNVSQLIDVRPVSLMNQIQAGENVVVGQSSLRLTGTKDSPSWATVDGAAKYIEFIFTFDVKSGGIATLALYKDSDVYLDSIQDDFDIASYATSYVVPVDAAEYIGFLFADYENRGSEVHVSNINYGDQLGVSATEHIGYLIALESSNKDNHIRYEAFVTEDGFWPVYR